MLPDTATQRHPAGPRSVRHPALGVDCCPCLLLSPQVFPKSGWATMFNAVKKSVAAGGPAYQQAEYTVMDNPYQAVKGGWKVRQQRPSW